MAKVRIYGSSDDCIELDGDIYDEFSAYDCAKHLVFSDGTAVRCEYDADGYSGKWKIEVVRNGSSIRPPTHEPALDDDENYSDFVTLTGDLTSVECWSGLEPTKDELLEKFGQREGFDDLSVDQLKRIHAITKE